jgi:hypothetical protein
MYTPAKIMKAKYESRVNEEGGTKTNIISEGKANRILEKRVEE